MINKPHALDCLILCVIISGVLTGNTQAQTIDSPQLTRQEKIGKAKEYHLAGEQYLQEGNYTAADEAFKKAQQLLGQYVKTDIQPPVTQAQVLTKEGKSEQPIAHYLKGLETNPKNPDLYYNLAVEYLKINGYKQAAEALKKVIKLNPRDGEAYY
jgi:tetratricopeptide (TPR) repeat protein